MPASDNYDQHLQELRRGTPVVASLLILRQPDYGYRLLERLAHAGFDIEANTLYPLLRRLEKQGLLVSDWNTEEGRPRKYYRTTAEGLALARHLQTDWSRLTAALEAVDRGMTND